MRGTVNDVIRKVKGIEPIDPKDEELLDLMDEEPDKVHLILDIDTAIADGEYPGDDRLVDDPLDAESTDLANAVRGKRWRDVSIDAIIDNRQGLSFFSAVAFRHYLPAFLIAALAYPRATDVLSEFAFGMLCPPHDRPRFMPWFLERVEGFDTAERKVLKSYVELHNKIEHSYPDPRRQWAADFWNARCQAQK